jgi:hypothetical protein
MTTKTASARRIRSLCSRDFSKVEDQINRLAGEGRWPVLASLRSVPFVGDLIGHKPVVSCREPQQQV